MKIAAAKNALFAVVSVALFAGSSTADDRFAAPVSGVDRRITYYHHASTYEEGIRRGAADVISAYGEARRNIAISRVYDEEAKSKAIDNDYKSVSNYFAKRELNRQVRFGKKPVAAQAPTEQGYQVSPASHSKPRRAGVRELDPVTGTVRWPRALLTCDFDAERAQLNQFFADRARNNGAAGSYWDVRDVTESMLAKLQRKIRHLNPQEYINAKRLVRNLAEEARMPAPAPTLASN